MSIHSDKLAHVQVVFNCRCSVAQMCTREDMPAHKLDVLYLDEVMSYYSDKLAHVQVVINCRYSIAQMCTREDTPAHK